MLSPERLAEIRARCEAVPAWVRGEEHECMAQFRLPKGGRLLFTVQDSTTFDPGASAVRDFIEHAPADVVDLLAEVERLRALVDAQQAALDISKQFMTKEHTRGART